LVAALGLPLVLKSVVARALLLVAQWERQWVLQLQPKITDINRAKGILMWKTPTAMALQGTHMDIVSRQDMPNTNINTSIINELTVLSIRRLSESQCGMCRAVQSEHIASNFF
jgi:hypothetical protein